MQLDLVARGLEWAFLVRLQGIGVSLDLRVCAEQQRTTACRLMQEPVEADLRCSFRSSIEQNQALSRRQSESDKAAMNDENCCRSC